MSSNSFNLLLKSKIPKFKKTIEVDADKSLSIRSFIIGSISQGVSTIFNVLESDDVKFTISACRKLGIKILKIKHGNYKIFGKGLGSFTLKKNSELNFSNSGTASRLLLGALSTTPDIHVKIRGDHSLNRRSMKKLIDLLTKFGATFLPKGKDKFPLKMISSKMPVGIKYKAGISAQLKSAAILAGLNCYGNTKIEEQIRSRNHTENLLIKNKQAIKIQKKNKRLITIFGKTFLKPLNFKVGGDPSSAAFYTALTLLNENSYLKIKNVGLNRTRTGFFKILKKQKANIKFLNLKEENNELYGDIVVKSCKLIPIQAPANIYSQTTDEYLILFVLAALTNGISTFRGIADLANKESSRAHEMKKILSQIGVKCQLTRNEMKIYGKGIIDASNKKIIVENLGDHRVAMCAFILSILTNAKTKIKNFETVYTSSPSFLKIMKSLGAQFEIEKK
jgi:3-phosphoshikimate 1-carboxyvinyltransferase